MFQGCFRVPLGQFFCVSLSSICFLSCLDSCLQTYVLKKIKTARFMLCLGKVHKGRPTIMGHFGHTYLPMSHVFYTMPISLVLFLLRYLPTPKSDVLYERSLSCSSDLTMNSEFRYCEFPFSTIYLIDNIFEKKS